MVEREREREREVGPSVKIVEYREVYKGNLESTFFLNGVPYDVPSLLLDITL